MKLLSKPSDLDYANKREYENFSFFRLALTERNWSGLDYIRKEDCFSFIEQLKDLEPIYNKLLKEIDLKTRLTFLIDTSVFSLSISDNTKVVDLLEESKATYEQGDNSTENTKTMDKLLKKLRNFADKPENFSLIFRWAIIHKKHPFSPILKELIEQHVINIGIRSKNDWIKDIKMMIDEEKKMRKKNIDIQIINEKKKELDIKTVVKCEKRDVSFLQKLLKNSITKPTLFILDVYFFLLYFIQLEDMLTPGVEFISIQKTKNEMDIFLKDSTDQLDELFLQHETFISSLPRQPRKVDGTFDYYFSLYQLQESFLNDKSQIKDVFKTIAKWIVHRLETIELSSIPKNKKWIHPISGELFTKLGLTYMLFEDTDFIGGPNGKELLIKTRVLLEENGRDGDFLFPIFDPHSWENLNVTQCALLAYSLCLYHDICVEKNFEFVSRKTITSRDEEFDYLLVTNSKWDDFSPLSTHFVRREKSTSNTKKMAEKSTSKHWVSFHFRKLRPNHNASEKAKLTSLSYGIPELPNGFTFVSSFVRGESKEISELKFHALDILNKTIRKLENYYKQENKVLS